MNDTLLVKFPLESNPMDVMYLFKNDTCFYQQINLYCSPCAEVMLHRIIRDKRYKFEEIDGINYISRKQPNIVLRLGGNIKDENICTDIRVIRLDKID
jgi:hypothetical protein